MELLSLLKLCFKIFAFFFDDYSCFYVSVVQAPHRLGCMDYEPHLFFQRTFARSLALFYLFDLKAYLARNFKYCHALRKYCGEEALAFSVNFLLYGVTPLVS